MLSWEVRMSEYKIATFLNALFDLDSTMSRKEAMALFDSMTERERQMTRDIVGKKVMEMTKESIERITSFGVE
jgi:hypothetical protein